MILTGSREELEIISGEPQREHKSTGGEGVKENAPLPSSRVLYPSSGDKYLEKYDVSSDAATSRSRFKGNPV